MNRLSTEKRAQIVGALVEGNSIRATVRLTGAANNTVTKLLVDLGAASAEYQAAELVDLPCRTIQVDEIWAFCEAKAKNVPASTGARSARTTPTTDVTTRGGLARTASRRRAAPDDRPSHPDDR